MTNREWYLNKLNKMTNKELANYIETEVSPWCNNSCPDDCPQCAKEWFDKEYIEPMPELKDGMFVEAIYNNNVVLGVVLNNKIILQDGQWCSIKQSLAYITKVFNTCCFNLCDGDHCIWRKE